MESITEEGFRLKMVMEEFRVFPDVFTYYSALIDGLCKECRLDDANLFFSEMCDRGLVPNGVTFITLINGQCKSGRVDLASEIYQQMVTKALKADLVLYNTLVNGFCKGGYFRESRKLVGEMTKRGLRPDKFMYTTLLDAQNPPNRQVSVRPISSPGPSCSSHPSLQSSPNCRCCRRHKSYTKEAVELSAKLLEINPECYTAWNYRKLAVQHSLFESNLDPDAVNSILNDELRVVENALRQNFKSYGAWYHRKWVLNKGHSSIENELRLLDKLQNVDPRNFHAWNYRRFVAALLNRSDEDELNHTQDLIDKNISNYSAWHNRSVLVSNLMKKKVQAFSQKDEVLIREYELVRDAVFYR
ncbi:hypothetical protein OIU77_031151 [Salix suchowensis]|uniref:Geranylgeranyl transferase type-2 subunit alpha n=1 Tax=Salix suchowensis TaxID=1278906 RepID=A0ABQ9BEI6_9ROSI|nr:hypothetical protein OIU77_031151 [Salix suchowensis]